jgi:CheY-like chemotaxis protein
MSDSPTKPLGEQPANPTSPSSPVPEVTTNPVTNTPTKPLGEQPAKPTSSSSPVPEVTTNPVTNTPTKPLGEQPAKPTCSNSPVPEVATNPVINTPTDRSFSVLLVDDDPDTRNVFRLVMDFHNYQLDVAEDAESALKFLREKAPDVIVMDIFLPGIDGYQALHQIRKHALVPNCRVVATTAYYTADTKKEVLAWGFSGYLPKPLNAMELVPYLKKIVEENREPEV